MWFPSRIFAALITASINPEPACSSLSTATPTATWGLSLGGVGTSLQRQGWRGTPALLAGLRGFHLLATLLLLTCAVSSLLFAPIFQAATQDRKWFKSQENVITNPQILAGEWRVGEVSESTFNSFFQRQHQQSA